MQTNVSRSGPEVPFRPEAFHPVALVGGHRTLDLGVEKTARSQCPEIYSERMESRAILLVIRSSTSRIVEVSDNDPFLPARVKATEVPCPPVKLISVRGRALKAF